jgi:hypothetical protein
MAALEKPNEYFSWERIGLDEATFRVLSSLVSIRNGGHVKLSAPVIAEGEATMITRTMYPPKAMTDDMIKRKFLDAISELVSTHATAARASIAALIEDSGTVTILLARNEGFDYEDRSIIVDMFAQLREYSRLGHTYTAVSHS